MPRSSKPLRTQVVALRPRIALAVKPSSLGGLLWSGSLHDSFVDISHALNVSVVDSQCFSDLTKHFSVLDVWGVIKALPNGPPSKTLPPFDKGLKLTNSLVNVIHHLAWEVVTRPKESGGLGISDLSDKCLALQAKRCWNLDECIDKFGPVLVDSIANLRPSPARHQAQRVSPVHNSRALLESKDFLSSSSRVPTSARLPSFLHVSSV
ncbi:hypothetical protein Cni_G01858 [Canna indica]|uniref:Uncharacterized protein n=1 Tax=Canna indica TaxID=4628 RepID=A0AAQ3PYX6_9LILI|nr:hypothetical protein Cni_G01858 [Canna indica]